MSFCIFALSIVFISKKCECDAVGLERVARGKKAYPVLLICLILIAERPSCPLFFQRKAGQRVAFTGRSRQRRQADTAVALSSHTLCGRVPPASRPCRGSLGMGDYGGIAVGNHLRKLGQQSERCCPCPWSTLQKRWGWSCRAARAAQSALRRWCSFDTRLLRVRPCP